MACARTCKSDESASDCRRRCGATLRRSPSLLEPDLAGYALMGAQLEMLAALGTQDRPRL
ncbi:MAG: hypothetical protein NBV67_02625 [Tagaea sp.]|nr:hypothetical protein [Tagaea sp.]